MPWQKKASAPASFSLKNAMAAMIAGTEASWLTDWMFWIPDAWFDTATFCAAGPPPVPDGLSLTDLLSAIGSGKSPAAWGLLAASLMPKFQAIANDRVFSAYCELPGPGVGNFGTDQCAHVGTAAAQNAPPATWRITAPAGAVRARTKCTAVDGKSGSRVFYCQVWTVDASGNHVAHVGDYIDPSVPTGYLTFNLNGAAAVQFENYDWVMGGTTCVAFDDGGPTSTTPKAEPQPAGAPPAVSYGTYNTIADLGAELDRQERKLDLALDGLRFLAQGIVATTGSTGPDTPVARDTKTPVGKAYGAVVTISGIPAAASSIAEGPTYWRNLGHVTMHTADGPLGAEPIVHTPQVFIFDPRTTDVSVSPMKPATASVRLLYPTK